MENNKSDKQNVYKQLIAGDSGAERKAKHHEVLPIKVATKCTMTCVPFTFTPRELEYIIFNIFWKKKNFLTRANPKAIRK